MQVESTILHSDQTVIRLLQSMRMDALNAGTYQNTNQLIRDILKKQRVEFVQLFVKMMEQF